MHNYFTSCYTPDEVKARYRKLAKTMHPDGGGTDAQFKDLQAAYEAVLNNVQARPQLPQLYHATGLYEYKGSKVVYYGCDCHWYKFDKPNGAYIWIDAEHTFLIRHRNGIY